MKIIRITGAVAVIAFAAFWVGCGGSTSSSSSDGSDMSEPEATAMAEQISQAAITAMLNMDVNASEGSGAEADASKTVQCNPDTGTCTINIPISYRLNCSAGGRMEVSGDITGTTSDGSGILQIGLVETITDWQCITGFIVNGDPYISLTGTFTFLNNAPATQQSMTISGGFKWGTAAAESCQISLAINFGTDGSGTISGSVCGYSVYATF